MPRPLRSTFPYGIYHLTSRGVDGRPIFTDDDDRRLFVHLLFRVTERFAWKLHVYCLMGNHFHLIVECGQPALSKGMERLNGLHASGFNARHGRVGHLFQRRFESRQIADDDYLENACGYVARIPSVPGSAGASRTGRGAARDSPTQPSSTLRRVRSGALLIPQTSS